MYDSTGPACSAVGRDGWGECRGIRMCWWVLSWNFIWYWCVWFTPMFGRASWIAPDSLRAGAERGSRRALGKGQARHNPHLSATDRGSRYDVWTHRFYYLAQVSWRRSGSVGSNACRREASWQLHAGCVCRGHHQRDSTAASEPNQQLCHEKLTDGWEVLLEVRSHESPLDQWARPRKWRPCPRHAWA